MYAVMDGAPTLRALHLPTLTELHRYAVTAIEWGLVPMILVILFAYGISLTPSDRSLHTSATAGKVSGLILFVIFVISQKGRALPASFSLPNYDVQLWPFLASMVFFFSLFGVLNRLLRTRVVCFLALLLVFASLVTSYSYLFLPSYRPTIVYVVLGGVLGALLETLLFGRDPITGTA